MTTSSERILNIADHGVYPVKSRMLQLVEVAAGCLRKLLERAGLAFALQLQPLRLSLSSEAQDGSAAIAKPVN